MTDDDLEARAEETRREWVESDYSNGSAIGPVELISAPLLVQLSETEWVNPNRVVHVVFRDSMSSDVTSAPSRDPRVCIAMDGGHGFVIRDRSLAEIVALFNGEAE